MDSQNSLSQALELLFDGNNTLKEIDTIAKQISLKYRKNNNDGVRLVTSNREAVAYALSRMPATYKAISSCIEQTIENNAFSVDTIGDFGAGTGAATWAAHDYFEDSKCFCMEREQEMINIGKSLMNGQTIERNTEWYKFDITSNKVDTKYDFVISSYMINELPENLVVDVVSKLWNATNKVLLIVEPGTPNGFSNILKIRDFLIGKGANVIAPCTHQNKCQLAKDDWCHFTCRVQRSKIHKVLKDGTSPFEDEKYSYIAVSKKECVMAENRILRHPIINKGYSEYKVCSKEGIKNIKLSKKDGAKYKVAKKKSAGDSLYI